MADNMKELAAEAASYAEFSPDIPFLYARRYHTVFVYDSFKRGFENHVDIERSIYRGEAETLSNNFVLYERNGLGYATLSPFKQDRGQIRGELYTVRTETLIDLDTVVSNTVHYNRIRVNVLLPFRRIKDGGIAMDSKYQRRPFEAWMYIASPDATQLLKKEPGIFKKCEKIIPTDHNRGLYTFK